MFCMINVKSLCLAVMPLNSKTCVSRCEMMLLSVSAGKGAAGKHFPPHL